MGNGNRGSEGLGADRGTGGGAYGNQGQGPSADTGFSGGGGGVGEGGGVEAIEQRRADVEAQKKVDGRKGPNAAEQKFITAQKGHLEAARQRAGASALSQWRIGDFLSSFEEDQAAHLAFLQESEGDFAAATTQVTQMTGQGSTMQDLFTASEWWR